MHERGVRLLLAERRAARRRDVHAHDVGLLAGLERADAVVAGPARARRRRWPCATTSRAGSGASRCFSRAMPPARPISSNVSSRLLHAPPSEPRPQRMPCARHALTSASPEPSFRLEPGQCTSAASACFMSFSSSSSSHTPCAPTKRSLKHAVAREVRRRVLALGPLDLGALVGGLGDVRVDEHAALARDLRHVVPQPLAARENEARRQRDAQPAAGGARRTASPGAPPRRAAPRRGRACPRGTPSPASMSAGPNTARMPVAASVSPTTSVWRTVPMSLTQVTPPAISSQTPSRTEAAIDASVCAFSSGQMLSRSQRSRSLCSASPRKSVWHRCRWPCTNPGQHQAAGRRRTGRASRRRAAPFAPPGRRVRARRCGRRESAGRRAPRFRRRPCTPTCRCG